jgi:hypothetical protein
LGSAAEGRVVASGREAATGSSAFTAEELVATGADLRVALAVSGLGVSILGIVRTAEPPEVGVDIVAFACAGVGAVAAFPWVVSDVGSSATAGVLADGIAIEVAFCVAVVGGGAGFSAPLVGAVVEAELEMAAAETSLREEPI